MILWIACLGAGFGLWIAFVTNGWESIWYATLVNFLFFFFIASGMFMWTVLLSLSRASWAEHIEYRTAASIGFAIPSLIILGVLWAGAYLWAPWPGNIYPAGVWLNTSFLFGRDLFIIAVFWILCFLFMLRRHRGATRLAGFIALWFFWGFTVLAWDLIMAMEPPWKSALFGPYIFVSALYAGIVTWTLVSVRSAEKKQLHDMGKLILTLSLLTTYFFFCQLLTIWYENIPAETQFVVPRYNYPWRWASLALIIVLYLGPLVFLLSRKLKMNRWYMAMVTIMLLCALWVQCWWLIVPAFSQRKVEFGIACFAAFLLIGGLFLISYQLSLRPLRKIYSCEVKSSE